MKLSKTNIGIKDILYQNNLNIEIETSSLLALFYLGKELFSKESQKLQTNNPVIIKKSRVVKMIYDRVALFTHIVQL